MDMVVVMIIMAVVTAADTAATTTVDTTIMVAMVCMISLKRAMSMGSCKCFAIHLFIWL